ncbi:hypothetical protein [Acetobacterium bakii]|uniref:Uncharacterized protein n=1 Tax=Acetobacterium bakii TaxID=52689 RepID=A0A0L6U023_9FIRM|nr:hypothetical protein [Acetobacterium bakii]KNZ41849.1 hypothetical protein AKG39_09520 [Acetobacterium bakii]
MFGLYILILILICIGVGTGLATASLAKNKGYSEEVGLNGYFFAGFFFGIFAMIYVAGLPLSEKMREEERIKLIQEIKKIGITKQEVVTERKTVIADDLPQW